MRSLLKGELIGLEIEVAGSKNRYNTGLKGHVVDETKNTIVIETEKGEKRLLKAQNKFAFKLNKKMVLVEGKLLLGRPEERIKK